MNQPKIAIIMGSQSDWPTMKKATEILKELEIEFEAMVVSAHRTPERMFSFAKEAESKGFTAIIAGAGGAAHLPGMVAALTHIPVIAVPVQSKSLKGLDSLLSIVQMPKGVAVATQAIGEAGGFNAGLMAAQIVATSNSVVRDKLVEWRKKQSDSVPVEVE